MVVESAAPSLGEEAPSSTFAADAQDSQAAGEYEYASDIFAKLLGTEALCLPKPDYMDSQPDLNAKMRAILVDWLVEVHMKYHLRPETLFLTVNIIDRYASLKTVARKKFQLLGVVAMFIAAKFEEIDPPRAHEFSYITDHTYSKREILEFEAVVLATLDFQIAVPTPAHFLDRWQRANDCDGMHSALAQYALELALLHTSSLRYPPSVLVAASLLLSNQILGRRPAWPVAMAQSTRQTEASLAACTEELRGFFMAAGSAKQQVVQRKYRLEQRFAVSTLSLPGPGVKSRASWGGA